MNDIRFLVVDDSKAVRAVIHMNLQLGKLPIGAIHQAENGAEALKVLEDHDVDFILTDINMPVMSGNEFARNVGNDPRLRKIPVVAIYQKDQMGVLEGPDETLFKEIVPKPFTPDKLRDTVLKYL